VAVNDCYWWSTPTGNLVRTTRKAAKGLLSRRVISIWKEYCHTLLPPLYMNADEPPVGRWPNCGEDISEAWVLVEYEKDDGTEGVWTECPACEDVVAPE
jgi:hypothetical protein